MKKLIVLILILAMLAGCSNSIELKQFSNEVSEDENAVTQDAKIISPPLKSTTLTSNTTIPTHNDNVKIKNVVVENPKTNELTYEICETLVGKYVTEEGLNENGEGNYFEIRADGTVEFAFYDHSGFGKYESEQLYLSAFYSARDDDYYSSEHYIHGITIAFNIAEGTPYTFPGSLSISFKTDIFGVDEIGEYFQYGYDTPKYIKQ